MINIITKDAKDTRGTLISAGGGNVNQGFLDMRYGGGNDRNFSYRMYAKGSTDSPEFHADNEQFDDQRRTQAGFRTDWEVTGRDTLTIQGDVCDGLAGESVRVTSLSAPFSTDREPERQSFKANVLGRWKTYSGGRLRYHGPDVLRPGDTPAGEPGRIPRHIRFRHGASSGVGCP